MKYVETKSKLSETTPRITELLSASDNHPKIIWSAYRNKANKMGTNAILNIEFALIIFVFDLYNGAKITINRWFSK